MKLLRQSAQSKTPRRTPSRVEIERIAGVIFVDEHDVAIWPTIELERVKVEGDATELHLAMDFNIRDEDGR